MVEPRRKMHSPVKEAYFYMAVLLNRQENNCSSLVCLVIQCKHNMLLIICIYMYHIIYSSTIVLLCKILYINVYIYICTCVYIYIYIHTYVIICKCMH